VRGSWGRAAVVAAALTIGLTACSGSSEPDEAEVGGVALERGEDGGTVAVDDERGRLAEDEGLVGTDEPPDERDDRAEADRSGAPASEAEGPDGEGSGSVGTTAGTDGPAASGGAPTPTATPAPAPRTTPSSAPVTPRPTPTPTASPSPTPAPRVLQAGPARTFSEASAEYGAWVVLSGTPAFGPGELPPPFRVDVDVQGEGGPTGGAVCAVRLQAGEDRGLVARGTATVTLVLTDHDGATTRLLRQRLDLDVHLGAGGSVDVDPSPPVQVDAADWAAASCEARFDPS
jgi:hypothetical protein